MSPLLPMSTRHIFTEYVDTKVSSLQIEVYAISIKSASFLRCIASKTPCSRIRWMFGCGFGFISGDSTVMLWPRSANALIIAAFLQANGIFQLYGLMLLCCHNMLYHRRRDVVDVPIRFRIFAACGLFVCAMRKTGSAIKTTRPNIVI